MIRQSISSEVEVPREMVVLPKRMEIVFEKHELCNTRRNSPRGGTSSSCRYEWCSRSNRTTALR